MIKLNLTGSEQSGLQTKPEIPGDVEVSSGVGNIPVSREKLQNILAKEKISPKVTAEIQERLAAIESGLIPPVPSSELTEAIKKAEQVAPVLTSDIPANVLVDSLNGSLDLEKKADELGAGFEITQKLISDTAKRYAENSKN